MFGIDVRQKAWSAGLIVLFFVAMRGQVRL